MLVGIEESGLRECTMSAVLAPLLVPLPLLGFFLGHRFLNSADAQRYELQSRESNRDRAQDGEP